jgi:proline racemase
VIDFISYVMLVGDDDPVNGSLRGATVLNGRVDRSPCGTGNSARLAVLAARGAARVGSRFIARSLIDSEFIVEMIGETSIGDQPAVLPRISGRGWVVGTHTSTVEPADPYQLGYVLSDVWGDEVGSM